MKCKNCKNFEPKTISGKGNAMATPEEVEKGTFQPSFRTITILAGPQGSGKTVQAEKMAEGKRCIVRFPNESLSTLYNHGLEVLIIENVTSIRQIKQIIKHKLQIKEIIICTTL